MYGSSIGIPFPTSSSHSSLRDSPPRRPDGLSGRNSISIETRRASVVPPSVEALNLRSAVESKDSFRVDLVESGGNSVRNAENETDGQYGRVVDARKRSSGPIWEESNGGAYSNYVAKRMGRVVEDYGRIKVEEERERKMGAGALTMEQMRRGSVLPSAAGLSSMRSSSLTQLPLGSLSPLMEGPVELIDWFPKENGREHRTDFYELTQGSRRVSPIYRRGQNFFMALRLHGSNVDLTRQPLTIYFNFGSKPSFSQYTKAALPVSNDREFMGREKSEWDCRLHHQEGNTLMIQVSVAVSAPVGVWSCEIHYNNEVHYCKDDIYILFNPYSSEDSVYLDNEQNRKEYVLADSGKVYTGTASSQVANKWVFGQFNEIVLPFVCLFLDRYTENESNVINFAQRGNPTYVTKALASMIYSKYGVLKEIQNYEGASFSSSSHSGSLSLIEKLFEQNFRPIMATRKFYASALYVTFCRALGIPCRSITSYRAPIEKNSMNVDVFWDEANEKNSDLYEAYRCWNDVWIRKNDSYSSTYYGWHGIDPIYQGYGPASAESVRRGDNSSYDNYYFYTMLNCQMRHFYCNSFPEKVLNEEFGRLIITKRNDRDDDDDDFEDITHIYKKKDGSSDEVYKSSGGGSSMTLQRRSSMKSLDKVVPRGEEGVSIEWSYVVPSFGQTVLVSALVKNNSQETRTLVLNYYPKPLYGGITGRKIKQFKKSIVLQPNQRESLNLELLPQEYQDKLDDEYTIRFYASAYIKELDQFVASDEDVALIKPKINILMRSTPQVDMDCQINFSMTNPLSVPLTDSSIVFEGPGLTRPMMKQLRDVKPGETLNVNEKFVPKKAGDSRIIAVFNSRQLKNVMGSKLVSTRD